MNTAKQIGGAVGLAVLVAVASAPTGLAFDVAFTAMATIVVAVGLGAWLLPGPMAGTGSAAVRSQ